MYTDPKTAAKVRAARARAYGHAPEQVKQRNAQAFAKVVAATVKKEK